jgi:hypothetical protein
LKPSEHKEWRLRVLATFLRAGVPVNKINEFRPLLQHSSAFSLTDASHLAKLIPVLSSSMQSITCALVKGRYVVVLFDGTPHCGEVISIVIRFRNGRVRQRILDFIHLNKTPDATELFRVLLSLLLSSTPFLKLFPDPEPSLSLEWRARRCAHSRRGVRQLQH